MTNYPIDDVLEKKEKIIEIDLVNKATGTMIAKVPVQENNTLWQLVEEYAEDIGINADSPKIHFENKRTGVTTSDSSETLEDLGVQDRDVLAFTEDGCVAGEEDVFEISLFNKVTGATYPQVAVIKNNTLGQIIEEYAGDIGVTINKKLLFMNKRTGQETSDSEMTVQDLGLQEGDVLAITDDAPVAAVRD